MKKINRWLGRSSVAIALITLLTACGYRVSFSLPGQPKPTPSISQRALPPKQALEVALSQRDFVKVKQLLATASAKDIDQAEALPEAIRCNQPELIQLMLKRGANPNLDSALPLRQAIDQGNNWLVQLLLQHGADPNRQDGNTDSMLRQVMFGNAYIGFLSWHKDIEQLPQVNAQQLETIRLILEAGANPNDRDRANGTTALMVAAAQGNEPLFELLLQKGANPNVVNAYGETALHYAAWRDNAAIVQRLLAQKVSVNPANGLRTPLMFAARRGSLPVVKLLLAHGAKTNAVSREILPDPNRVRYVYQSVLDHAIAANHPDIVALLKQRGAKPFQQK